MCEEVKEPSRQVPKAIIGTVIFNTIAGLIFLIPIVFVLPDPATLVALASGQPVPTIIKSAVGNEVGSFLLLLVLAVLALLCGIGCTTAVSRSVWAFARDGGIPYSKKWKKVNKSLDVPVNAMMLGMVVEIALGLIYFGSSTAFSAFSGVGVITLTVSYACPVAVSCLEGRTQVKKGNFYLGKLGLFCNVITLGKFHFTMYCHGITLICFLHSLEFTRSSSVLYAICNSCHSRDCQLCSCCLCGLHHDCYCLVLHLGPREIHWATHR